MDDLIRVVIAKDLAGAPTEFQLVPYGTIELLGEEDILVDEESAASIVAFFERRGNDMVIDYEHQTEADPPVEAPAAGWIKRIINKGKDGVWAAVEWTERAARYLANKEYRYFSPVYFYRKKDRKLMFIKNMALTNEPKTNNIVPLVAKLDKGVVPKQLQANGMSKTTKKEEKIMLEKLIAFLKLAADASEEKVLAAVEALAAKAIALEAELATAVAKTAAPEILAAVGAAESDDIAAVVAKVEGLKATDTAAQQLSQQVASLRTELAEIKQADLIDTAMKDGKTDAAELDAWGRELAKNHPEQFEKIVLSRQPGSVVPVGSIGAAPKVPAAGLDDLQKSVNKMMGLDDETFQKYNSKAA